MADRNGYARVVEALFTYTRDRLTEYAVPAAVIEELEIRNREVFQAQVYALQKYVDELEGHVRSSRRKIKSLNACICYLSKPEELAADSGLLQSLLDYLSEEGSEELAAWVIADLRRRFPRAHLRPV